MKSRVTKIEGKMDEISAKALKMEYRFIEAIERHKTLEAKFLQSK